MIGQVSTLQETITRWDYTDQTPNWIRGYTPEVPLREEIGRDLAVKPA